MASTRLAVLSMGRRELCLKQREVCVVQTGAVHAVIKMILTEKRYSILLKIKRKILRFLHNTKHNRIVKASKGWVSIAKAGALGNLLATRETIQRPVCM